MLSLFRNLSNFRRPIQLDISDFCETVFEEWHKNPSHDVGITEIRHFKEKDNMEHEFLLANITYSEGEEQKQCTLRLERSAATHQPTSLLQRMKGVSSSIFPANDTIWIASSDTQLISGMKRGDSFPVARLPFPQKPFSLRELCLILSFFPAFSPSYKLREEQCYWFCDVVLKTTLVAYEGARISKEKDFKKAGRFGRVSVKLSAPTRQLFIDAYNAVRALGENSESNTRSHKLPPLDAMPMLLTLLEVPSTEARSRAIDTITTLVKSSLPHRLRLVESQAVPKLASMVTSFPSMIAPGMVALQTLVGDLWWQSLVSDSWPGCVVGDSWPERLNAASMDIKIAYLSLASPDLNLPTGSNHQHIRLVLSSDFPSALVTLLQSSTTSHIQILAATAIKSHLEQVKSSATHDWIVELSNALSSPLYSPDMKHRIADFLVAVVRHKTVSKVTLLQANTVGMLTSESEDLKTLIINKLYDFPPGEVLQEELLTAGYLLLEQVTLAHPPGYEVLSSLEYLIARLKHYAKTEGNPMAIIVIIMVILEEFLSRVFSGTCTREPSSILGKPREGVYGRDVADCVHFLSHWSSCHPALLDVGLIPHDCWGYIGYGNVKEHLRARFPGWDWTV